MLHIFTLTSRLPKMVVPPVSRGMSSYLSGSGYLVPRSGTLECAGRVTLVTPSGKPLKKGFFDFFLSTFTELANKEQTQWRCRHPVPYDVTNTDLKGIYVKSRGFLAVAERSE